MRRKKQTIFIPQSLFIQFEQIRNSQSEVERCGILIGTISKSIKLTHQVEDPYPTNQSQTSVIRNIKAIWKKLNRIARDYSPADYIGEWHSHPHGSPYPSSIDSNAMKNIVRSDEYRNLSEVVLCVIGAHEIKFWLYGLNKHIELKFETFED